MAWQAIVNSVLPDLGGGVIVSMTFTDNVSQKVAKEYRLKALDLNSFKQQVQSDLDQQAASDPQKITLVPGPFDTTITPPVPTARDLYAAALAQFKQMNRAIAAGVKTSLDADYVTLQAALKKNFDSTFIDLF